MMRVFNRMSKSVVFSSVMMVSASNVIGSDNWQAATLNVQGVEVARGGQIQVFVFFKDGFPIKHEKAVRSYTEPATANTIVLAVDVPADAEFALKVHHDEDASQTVTKNWTGVYPAEGLGFSSGARIRLMPPSFADAKMTFMNDEVISIPMIYP